MPPIELADSSTFFAKRTAAKDIISNSSAATTPIIESYKPEATSSTDKKLEQDCQSTKSPAETEDAVKTATLGSTHSTSDPTAQFDSENAASQSNRINSPTLSLLPSPPLPNFKLRTTSPPDPKMALSTAPSSLAAAEAAKAADVNTQSRLHVLEHHFSKRVSAIEEQLKTMSMHGFADITNKRLAADSPPESEHDREDDVFEGKNNGAAGLPDHSLQNGKPTWHLPSDTQDAGTEPETSSTLIGEAKSATTTKGAYIPLAIRDMKPYAPPSLHLTPISQDRDRAFSANFLIHFLGGSLYANGMYLTSSTPLKAVSLSKYLPSKTYYILDAETDPYAPTYAGEHGAKLVVAMRELDDVAMVAEAPVFVRVPGRLEEGVMDEGAVDEGGGNKREYYYVGHYKQSRWSDRLDRERMHEVVPDSVRMHWARIMTAGAQRPEWMRRELMGLVAAKPTYEGIVPGEGEEVGLGGGKTNASKALKEDLGRFLEEQREWVGEARRVVDGLSAEGVLERFDAADCNADPGLRFYWEYLECVKYERNFYYVLSQAMDGHE